MPLNFSLYLESETQGGGIRGTPLIVCWKKKVERGKVRTKGVIVCHFIFNSFESWVFFSFIALDVYCDGSVKFAGLSAPHHPQPPVSFSWLILFSCLSFICLSESIVCKSASCSCGHNVRGEDGKWVRIWTFKKMDKIDKENHIVSESFDAVSRPRKCCFYIT